jgi:hypothetical protein
MMSTDDKRVTCRCRVDNYLQLPVESKVVLELALVITLEDVLLVVFVFLLIHQNDALIRSIYYHFLDVEPEYTIDCKLSNG